MAEKKKVVFKASAKPSWALCLNPLALLLWTLDFLVWLVSIVGPLKWISYQMQKAYSVEVDTATRRKRDAPLVLTAVEGEEVRTVPALVNWASSKYSSLEAMGTREFLGDHKIEGARFPIKKFGETSWISYDELRTRAMKFGSALVEKFGMEPLPPGADVEKVLGPHTLLLFEDTSAVWMTAALGASYYSLIVATSYATLGIDSVAEAVNDSRVPVVVTNRKQVELVSKMHCPSLKTIIYTNLNVAPGTAPPESSSSSVRVEELESVIAASSGNVQPCLPSPETVALIMYTSGSTGKPKGVMIRHQSICSSIGGLSEVIGAVSTPGDCYLGYLPQAHILEFCAELTCLRLGVKIGYADPRTLSSTGACRVRPDGTINTAAGYPYPPGAIQEFRPAFMAGVPKIWDILKKAMEDNVAKMSPLKRTLFQIAFSGRSMALAQHRDAPLLKALVFSKLAKMLGGNLKATVSGGGAISSEVQSFVRTAFSAPAVQGYALTETCCSATFQAPDAANTDGIVGPPLSSVEIKLVSVDITDSQNKKYSATDTYHYDEPCRGRGEVWIRGPPISAGYFKEPEKTAEVFSKDGWFMTGDVGVWLPDGTLRIVDRLKNLVKLKGGEYVAIENMEKEYSTCHYVSGTNGGLLCYGDHDLDRPVAFVVVDEKKVSSWASENGISAPEFPSLLQNKDVYKEVLTSLQTAGKKGKLGSNEIIAGAVLLAGTGPVDNNPPLFTDPWTPENGMLTASNKLNRKPIIKEYGKNGVFEDLKQKGIK